MVNSNQHLYNSKTFSHSLWLRVFLVQFLISSQSFVKNHQKVYAKKVTSRVRGFKGYFHMSCKGHSQIKLWQKNHAIVNFLEHSQLKILHYYTGTPQQWIFWSWLNSLPLKVLFVFIWRNWSSQNCLLLRGSSEPFFKENSKSVRFFQISV